MVLLFNFSFIYYIVYILTDLFSYFTGDGQRRGGAEQRGPVRNRERQLRW